MIRSEHVIEFPTGLIPHLTDYSRREVEASLPYIQAIIEKTPDARVFYDDDQPLLAVGVIRNSLMQLPYLWFLLCTGIRHSHLRNAKRYMRESIKENVGLQTMIEDSFTDGKRFAEFIGFHPTSLIGIIAGRQYTIYEALP